MLLSVLLVGGTFAGDCAGVYLLLRVKIRLRFEGSRRRAGDLGR